MCYCGDKSKLFRLRFTNITIDFLQNMHCLLKAYNICVYFVFCSGTYDIYVEIEGKDKCVGAYDCTGSFGELALMYNMPRAATIIATSEGSLWAMVSTQPNYNTILSKVFATVYLG